MNKQQKIFNILAKEQKSMKVELTALADIKQYQSEINTASSKAQGQLNSAISALQSALKIANSAISDARKAGAMAKELGVDEGQFAGWEKQFVNNRDSFESAISAISKIQNNI